MIPTARPCACREVTIPYLSNVVVDEHGAAHYASYCPGQRIELTPDPAPVVVAPPWPTIPRCPTHETPIWVTGPDPHGLLAEVGCPCEAVAS